jgi:HSP20 family protein
MALTRWDPFSTLSRMDLDFDDLVRRTWGSQSGGAARSGFVPAVEMVTRDADVVIRLELPGVDPANDVDIEIEPGKLTIRGERRFENTTDERGGVLVRELRYGSFHREFALPEGIGEDAVDARYEHGMLEVVVRGVVRRPPEPKKVQIRSGDKSKTVETGKREEINS